MIELQAYLLELEDSMEDKPKPDGMKENVDYPRDTETNPMKWIVALSIVAVVIGFIAFAAPPLLNTAISKAFKNVVDNLDYVDEAATNASS